MSVNTADLLSKSESRQVVIHQYVELDEREGSSGLEVSFALDQCFSVPPNSPF